MKSFVMLIGVPCVGKSTWTEDTFGAEFTIDTVLVSSDLYIERWAREQGKTYSEIFKDVANLATKRMHEDLESAIKNGNDIVWDQTNLTRKIRAAKLAKIPADYRKIAVEFITPEKRFHDELQAKRAGKVIPDFIMQNMIKSYEPVILSEGFEVITRMQLSKDLKLDLISQETKK